ncbi:transglutaminase-like cysteine peptidase [Magnetospira sp. QH-2]|uniref:transglutaminase-like cysteine peptidase n=1 Tax=Magnetospira sp. (strain QH-2) TaxID=1288970 RepID=UPI0003E816D8|nr:transglutaminase-like cysteine peptidase [Magnetospira sp. QH-2]CCQ75234.1 conserved exported protein of unknown function [Magnetospira sp. QH-2]
MNRRAFLTLLSASAMAGFLPGSEAQARGKPGIFNSKEYRSTNLKAFDQWTKVVRRSRGALIKTADWKAFLAETDRKLPKQKLLEKVNGFANRKPYIVDPVNWGVEDYWATPTEFLARNGDCEDYAITKYMALKRLGFDPAKMRVVAVQDLNLRAGHAILAVYMDNDIMVLDNQVVLVTPADRIHHYQPKFSINEKAWWRHRGGPKKKRKS